jgi:hypothetical protein
MKNIYMLTITCCLVSLIVSAQPSSAPVRFSNGNFSGNKNLLQGKPDPETLKATRFADKMYVLVQFQSLPGTTVKQEMAMQGIQLFDYLPGNAYMAEIPASIDLTSLKKYAASGVYTVASNYKISPRLSKVVDTMLRKPGRAIAVSFFGSVTKKEVAAQLTQLGARLVETKIQPAHVVFINAGTDVINKIASLPFVTWISLQTTEATMLNYNNHGLHGVDALAAPGGRNLLGKNVTVGIGDFGDPSSHIDFTGRLINRTPVQYFNHGTHVTGSVGGGGLLNPMHRGMAPKSTLISQLYEGILVNTPNYRNDYGMVITNNSYYLGENFCPGEGEYDVTSAFVDDQMKSYSELLHVMAAGNDGGLNCTPYPVGYGTVKSGLQCGKNVLTVGAIDGALYTSAGFSSWGPVNDGRVKPEIVAGGVFVVSTYMNNSYWNNQGTSMAAPTAAGSVALLYERYRQLHSGANPAASLIKAVTCNTADDMGNPGPDYIYGFGMLNARRAVESLEGNRYFTGNMNNGGSTNFTITGVPAGAQQIKIMLYWPDVPGAPNAPVALVNNLDLNVTSPDASVHLPLILDPTPVNVGNTAVEGVDVLNNIEQVVINTPPAGDFTVTVNGISIPVGAQDYVISYEVIMPSVTVEYPFGNETLVPGETEKIRWSAAGGGTNAFTIEYSANNGSSWTTIGTAPSTARSFSWQVDNTATNNGLIRVTRDNVGYTDVSDYRFTILGQPNIISAVNPCPGYARLTWNTIPSATQYEVMMLVGDSMQTIAATTDTSYLLSGLTTSTGYWFSVRSINSGTAGRRAVAVNIVPSGGACSAPEFDNDLTTQLLLVPRTGRKFTSSELTSHNVTVQIKNLGAIATTGSFNVSYQVNGGTVVTQPVAASIAAGSTYDYAFPVAYDFSAAGRYRIRAWVNLTGDPFNNNDTLVADIKHLRNDALTLSPSYTEGFESALAQSYTSAVMGLDSLDRVDFSADNDNGRARPFINSGIARSGSRALTLDQQHLLGFSSSDSATATFNLSGYTPTDQIWLDFFYRNHGIDFDAPGNQVWARGNDQAAWVPVFTLPHNLTDIGLYRASPSINIREALAAAIPAQTISSSFQVRFGQQGFTSANSVINTNASDDGFSFDDVKITLAQNDIYMRSLVAPSAAGVCNLSATEPITVEVRNYGSTTANNITVTYSINGVTVTELIPAINAGQTINYTFTQTADLSAFQAYDISAWVNYSGDTYKDNDSTLHNLFRTTPMITSYPYLEGFESNNGHWYTGGINSSWQWGPPGKTIINKAANGANAWVTSLNGGYNNNELSYLYSPCFNLTSLTQPVLSFSHIFRLEDDCPCDFHWIEYTTDDITWTKLGASGSGTNWYDNAGTQAWQASQTTWHVASYDLPTIGAPKVRFRIVMNSDIGVTYEGIGIDDIHVFDKAAIYSGANISSGITQPVSGNGWIDFNMGGNRVLSINPNGQNLGNTTVKAFINTGAVRTSTSQYYLDRNMVVQPANAPASDVSVRFYFLETEAENLIHATGCATCTTIGDAYEAGVTQYSNALPEEDSTLNNNLSGTYRYFAPQTDVRIVPYDNGYYAEYNVSNFSEFWINGGGPGQNQPLPLKLLTFTVTKQNANASLKWSTAAEINTDKFIIEKSSDGAHFTAIGTVSATGSRTENKYSFTDIGLAKGVHYYRLKMMDKDAKFEYSPVRSLLYAGNDVGVHVYPNPASGVLFVVTSVNCNRVELRDVSGKIIRTMASTGLQNKLSLANISQGVYFVTVVTDAGSKVEKVIVK